MKFKRQKYPKMTMCRTYEKQRNGRIKEPKETQKYEVAIKLSFFYFFQDTILKKMRK